jgi:hypothetical protein
MQELLPLTISSSVKKNPTVLFTKNKEKYLLYEPFNDHNYINAELFGFIYGHFKIDILKKGYFNFRGKKYLCSQEVSGSTKVDGWQAFQWKDKRQFNRFIRSKALFNMYLADLFFPVFSVSEKWIIPGVKDRFLIYPFPSSDKLIYFDPTDIGKVGLNDPGIKSFLKHMSADLPLFLEDFLALNHEKFKTDLKYRISLYPEHRNQYWNQLQLCFEPEFIKYTKATIENYILKL